jgi:hypothetical protein
MLRVHMLLHSCMGHLHGPFIHDRGCRLQNTSDRQPVGKSAGLGIDSPSKNTKPTNTCQGKDRDPIGHWVVVGRWAVSRVLVG